MLALPALLVALVAFAAPAGAVTYLEQIERLRLINAFLLDYRSAGSPIVPQAARTDIVAEIIPQPAIDNTVGSKSEPVDPPPVIPRLRLRHVTAGGWMLGATASPPLEVMGYTAVWLGGELGLRGSLGGVHAELRVFGISGEVKGPITELNAKDVSTFRNTGGDLRAGVPFGIWSAYAGLGSGKTHTELDVEADGVHIEGENDYGYWLAGVERAGEVWTFTLEQHATEDFLYHIILAAAYRW